MSYRAISTALYNTKLMAAISGKESLYQWADDVRTIGEELRRENPHFDYHRFYIKCGYVDKKGNVLV